MSSTSRNVLFFLLAVWVAFSAYSQQDSTEIRYDDSERVLQEISSEQLTEFKQDKKLQYEEKIVEYTWWNGLKNWLYNILSSFFGWLFGLEKAAGYVAVFLRILPYLLMAIVLFLIIKFFINANTQSLLFSKENPNTVGFSEEERLIKTGDLQLLIAEALGAKNYRLAVRYNYLYILKLLTERELIDWQSQKTNEDYIKELSGSSLKSLFSKATRLYEYIWYGEFSVDELGYKKAETDFIRLKKSIATDV